MPNNSLKGTLEDFVCNIIEPSDVLWPKVQVDVNAIPDEHRRFRPTYLSKAMVHTWLAWQEEPGTKMGECFKKKYLDPAHANTAMFVAWARRLVTESPLRSQSA
jgi:hypothetical protein